MGLADAGDADADGNPDGAAVGLEQVTFDLLQQLVELGGDRLRLLAFDQHTAGIITEARQQGVVGEEAPQDLRQISEDQVRTANADIALQAVEIVDAQVGEGARLAVMHGLLADAVQLFLEPGAIEQPGDQIMAGHGLELFLEFGAGGLGANDHLGAGLAVIMGRREAEHDRKFLALAVPGGTAQLALVAAGGVVAEKILEAVLVLGGDQADHGFGSQIIRIVVAEQAAVGTVGIDMHAVQHVGDGVHRAVQQQLAAFFRFAQGLFGDAPLAPRGEVGQFPFDHQGNQVVGAGRHGILHAAAHGLGTGVGVDLIGEQDEGHIVGLTDDLAGFLRRHVAGVGAGQAQIPGLLERLLQILAGGDPVRAGRMPGIAQNAHQTLRMILRVVQNK